MSSRSKRVEKKKNANTFQYMLGSFIGICIGYYILNHVATWEDVPLGNTFYVLLGCVMIAAFTVILLVLLKQKYFPKKSRRKSSRPVFLEDLEKKDENK